MIKSLALLPILSLSAIASPIASNADYFNIEDNAILSVKDEAKEEIELRIYFEEENPLNELKENAFDGCTSLKTIMLSNCITIIPQGLFTSISSLQTINYTGSEDEFIALNVDTNSINVNYYSCDEGFVNFWKDEIRPSDTANICDISDETYHKMLSLYSVLDEQERSVVNTTRDGSGTIIDSIRYLKEIKTPNVEPEEKPELNKSTVIALILIIASIGMTFICIFYLLRERKLIK